MGPILDRFRFTGDACADALNTYAPKFLDEERDAMRTPWTGLGPRVWMNPPYSRCDAFIQRARMVAQKEKSTVCVLVPNSTENKWFHRDALPFASEIWFYEGRISFIDPDTLKPQSGNPCGSVLLVFGPYSSEGLRFGTLCSKKGYPITRKDREFWEANRIKPDLAFL